MRLRTILAVLLSPLVGTAVLVTWRLAPSALRFLPEMIRLHLFDGVTFYRIFGSAQLALVVSYVWALFLASPAYGGLWYFRRTSKTAYGIAGVCVGLFAFAIFDDRSYSAYINSAYAHDFGYNLSIWKYSFAIAVLAGFANAMAYWLIARPQKRPE